MPNIRRSEIPTGSSLLSVGVVSGFTTMVLLAGPWFHPIDTPVVPFFGQRLLLLFIETVALQSLIITGCSFLSLISPKVGYRILIAVHGAILISIWLNCMIYRWTGNPLYSSEGLSILIRLPTQLHQFANVATVTAHLLALSIIILYLLTLPVICEWVFRRIPRCFRSKEGWPAGFTVIACSVLFFSYSLNEIQKFSQREPTRHPYSIFGLPNQAEGSRNDIPHEDKLVGADTVEPETGRSIESISERVEHQKLLHRLINTKGGSSNPPRKAANVLVVILESFRAELVDPDVMPWLSSKKDEAIYCRNHYSGGNASQHGIFSIVNGLNAYWFHQPVTYTPLLNRLFREAGFRCGFFGSKNDWRQFMMDGFINPMHYDIYQVYDYSGIKTDQTTLTSALSFLNQSKADRQSCVAVTYLYSTHAPYESFAKDRVFRPYADDRIIYPYREDSKALVWNRYRNSARSLDRLLSKLDLRDTIVLITGDHGESFLEDQTIGHGTKINDYQNGCPAILFGPGVMNRELRCATTHSDLLPTLLSLTNIAVSNPQGFDGLPLDTTKESVLDGRYVCTRDYLKDQMAVFLGNADSKIDSSATLIDFDLAGSKFSTSDILNVSEGIKRVDAPDSRESILAIWFDQSFPGSD